MPDASIIHRHLNIQPHYFDYLPWAVQLHQEIIEFLGNSLLYRCSIVNTSRAFFDKSYVMFKTIVCSIIAVIYTGILLLIMTQYENEVQVSFVFVK